MSFKTILPIITIMFSILTSCGYFENDRTQYQVEIKDNIKIQKQENNEEIGLVYQETNEIFSGIVENCKSVYYDSVNRIIFCESVINQYNSEYYQINIIDSKAKNSNIAIKKQSIDKDTFLNKTKQINRKWEFPLSAAPSSAIPSKSGKNW